MSKWFLSEKKERKVYTIADKKREQQAFKFSLDLEPLAELWDKVCTFHRKRRKSDIENYRDFLSIMKSFWGEENALIKRFETLLNRFDADCDAYYRTVRESIDNALEEKRLELKAKQDGEEH